MLGSLHLCYPCSPSVYYMASINGPARTNRSAAFLFFFCVLLGYFSSTTSTSFASAFASPPVWVHFLLLFLFFLSHNLCFCGKMGDSSRARSQLHFHSDPESHKFILLCCTAASIASCTHDSALYCSRVSAIVSVSLFLPFC